MYTYLYRYVSRYLYEEYKDCVYHDFLLNNDCILCERMVLFNFQLKTNCIGRTLQESATKNGAACFAGGPITD